MLLRFAAYRRIVALVGLLCCCLAPAARALTADQLLLIVNKNVPAGAKLAQLYAEKRLVPSGRILELDLPTTEELPFDTYERQVVPAVREFLRQNGLEKKVTCAVTFYGVPIRIAGRFNNPSDREELAKVQQELVDLTAKTEPMVAELERLAASCDPSFITANGQKSDLDALARRAETALQRVSQYARALTDPAKQAELVTRTQTVIRPLLGSMGMTERQINAAKAAARSGVKPVMPATQAVSQFVQFRSDLHDLLERRYDPAAREKLRMLLRENLGPFEMGRLLSNQAAYFATENTIAAFDSELALLWWEYPRTGWMTNPLYFGLARNRAQDPPTLMVSRLDGPQSGTAREIMMTALKAEAEGLKGRIVIDSRGIPPEKNGKPDAFGQYDQTMRNLADLLQTKGQKVSLIFDEQEPVLKAGAVQGVAVYCGWYSVGQYIPACQFNPGAVAFHLASYTMATLRLDDARSWCRGMLLDGAAVTFGPVSEPYLHSFPKADEFFPLLFTGKLTLAEVYWKTTPLASWMLTLIGDPLYTPYRMNPALKAEDLPPRLQAVFAPPTTAPSAPGR